MPLPKYSLHNRRFIMARNGSGQPVAEIELTFVQDGRMLRGEFQGDSVAFGQMLGFFVAEAQIELHLQWICPAPKIHCGRLCGLVSGDNDHGLTLFVNWQRDTDHGELGWASFREILP